MIERPATIGTNFSGYASASKENVSNGSAIDISVELKPYAQENYVPINEQIYSSHTATRNCIYFFRFVCNLEIKLTDMRYS